MPYKEKLIPTRDGFQELWDSTQNPTMERLIAGIQSRKTGKADILKLTAELRNSHSLLDSELLRLGEFSEDYNSLWATKRTFNLGITEQLQSKTKSQVKRWMKLLKITSPRCKPSAIKGTEGESLIDASYLTHRPYELDMWGPASYGTLMYDLYDEMNVIVDHLDDGERLCKDVMKKEEEIDNDPEWKEELYDRQSEATEEKCRVSIEDAYNSGRTDTANPLYDEMMSYPSERDFKSAQFHKKHEAMFNDFVIKHSVLKLQDNKITPTERVLWGDDFEKIKIVRFAINHLDSLLSVKKSGKFENADVVELIRWCQVRPSVKHHKDNDHKLYNYICQSYKGNYSWHQWSGVFELNRMVRDSIQDNIAYSSRFERKLNKLKVDLKFDVAK